MKEPNYRIKSRVQIFCDESDHKYELTIDGHLMAGNDDGNYESVFTEEEIKQFCLAHEQDLGLFRIEVDE